MVKTLEQFTAEAEGAYKPAVDAVQNQINALQLQNAVAGVVRYPMSTTYTSGCNPFCGGCGCGSI